MFFFHTHCSLVSYSFINWLQSLYGCFFFRPLPHVRGSSNYSPTGNPVYARDMLLFPAEGDNCKLGKDTVILKACLVHTCKRLDVIKQYSRNELLGSEENWKLRWKCLQCMETFACEGLILTNIELVEKVVFRYSLDYVHKIRNFVFPMLILLQT